MELKPYQQQVINDLALFLNLLKQTQNTCKAFTRFWEEHPRTPLQPFLGNAIEPYKNNIPRVPHVCVKVPTAGGKTFIACNALKTIFDSSGTNKPQAVVWLVPSTTILDQTLNNLKDPHHPYRQKINTHFGSRVEVFDKATLLQGSGFNATTIHEQLNIMVFSFDSLRAKNKEDRKVFQENGNLQSFEQLLPPNTDITLGAVLKYLNPLVVVDESHNAETNLSVDMLKELNPSFILDLTATPRKNSNLITFVDAIELKRENMVKLPLIVYNHHDKTEVINSALQLQKRLEQDAIAEQKKGGQYIRPIVLFQAQSNTNNDNTTFEKLREKLIELQIPAEQIKIKTANINEIKNEELMQPNCPVRYIITINALKEGWDCPFAYILASLADRSSAVDVEQIVGRILRQPYTTQHSSALLNMSYVLTASVKFRETLQNIVKGLNKAGFSDQDYKLANEQTNPDVLTQLITSTSEIISDPPTQTTNSGNFDDIDTTRIINNQNHPEQNTLNNPIDEIEKTAHTQDANLKKLIDEQQQNNITPLPTELKTQVKTYSIKTVFKEQAAQIKLPQFYIEIPAIQIFNPQNTNQEVLLEKENLLSGFVLNNQDINIDFKNTESELYKIDLDETRNEHTPTFIRVDGAARDKILTYILDPDRKENRVKNISQRITKLIGNIPPISDKDLLSYINRIISNFSDEQFNDFGNSEHSYVDKIKSKIRSLTDAYAEQQFVKNLDTETVFVKPSFMLPHQITPGEVAKDMVKSLYQKEGKMNNFEEEVINQIAHLSNIVFWTRNTERKGFKINGFINHYPDFIILTKQGKIILLETKGDHLDAEQKIRLGNLWASSAGNKYRYYLVYKDRIVKGAHTLDSFLSILNNL